MMTKTLDEGNFRFDFSAFDLVERFDVKVTNPRGLKSVDFIVESSDVLYFIEVKDFQNPKAPQKQREDDLQKLIDASGAKRDLFNIEMGMKLKDSLLRKYAQGSRITKKVVYLLFINLDKLGEFERGLLKTKINGYIPYGLNTNIFTEFTSVEFDLVNTVQLRDYKINCTIISGETP